MGKSDTKDSPLDRYISILEMIAPFADGLTAAELEAALDLPKTTINRLLHVLADSGMVKMDATRGRSYRLGDRVLRLLHSSTDTSWVEAVSQRPLAWLAQETGQSAFISKFDGSTVRSLTCVAPDTPVKMYVVPGMAMPINATATGKAILAFQPGEVIENVIAGGLQSFTENTKADPAALRSELELVRKRGFATDLAEHVVGLGTIAFPIITDASDVTYAVGLTGPYGRIIDLDFESHCQALAEAARRLSKLIQLPLHHAIS